MTDYDVVWTGATWREDYHPKPAPPLAHTPPRRHVRRRQQRLASLLEALRKQPMTTQQMEQAGSFGTSWNVRLLVRRLKASGQIQAVGQRYGSDGPPATVYGVRRGSGEA